MCLFYLFEYQITYRYKLLLSSSIPVPMQYNNNSGCKQTSKP